MSRTQRMIVLAIAVLVAIVLVVWFSVSSHDAHAVLRALHHAL